MSHTPSMHPPIQLPNGERDPKDTLKDFIAVRGWSELLSNVADLALEQMHLELAASLRLLARDPAAMHKALGIPMPTPLCPCQGGDRNVVCACYECEVEL